MSGDSGETVTPVEPVEPTPRQEVRYMERAARAVYRMGASGRRWLLRWMRDTYPDDWAQVRDERRWR